MEKIELKEATGGFFLMCDIEDVKKSMWDIYESLMMSDSDISIEERQRFTFACKQMEDLLNDLSSIKKSQEKG